MTPAVIDQNGEIIEGGLLSSAQFHTEAAQTMAIQFAAAMLDKRIATARNWPRSIAKFKARAKQLLSEDVETAISAEYAKPVGKGVVKGPSIRLAELAAMCWGNLDVEIGEPIVNDNNVVVMATAWDLENNYRQGAIASTSIIGKHGRYPGHMIETTAAATASKAKRNAIQAIIPKAYINDLLEHARAVARGNIKTLEERRASMVEAFARKKITGEQIFEALNVNGIDDINDDHVDTLRGIWTSINEGEPVETFFKPSAESKTEALKKKLDKGKGKDKEPAKDTKEVKDKQTSFVPDDQRLPD